MSDEYEMEIGKLKDWNEELEAEKKQLREALTEIIRLSAYEGTAWKMKVEYDKVMEETK